MVVDGYQLQVLYGTGVDPDAATGAADTAITRLLNATPPDPDIDYNETSYMYSPDQWREYQPGWKDPGEPSFTKHHDSQSTTLASLAAAGKKHPFKVKLSNGAEVTFDGYFNFPSINPEREGLVEEEYTIRATGKATYTGYSAT